MARRSYFPGMLAEKTKQTCLGTTQTQVHQPVKSRRISYSLNSNTLIVRTDDERANSTQNGSTTHAHDGEHVDVSAQGPVADVRVDRQGQVRSLKLSRFFD
jgi:alkaline phosphatase